MQLIEPKFEIWEQGTSLEAMWEHIARCTRVCYQSQSNVKEGETAEQFVKRVILRETSNRDLDFTKLHLAMLEHGTIYLEYTVKDPTKYAQLADYHNAEDTIHNLIKKYDYNPYSKIFVNQYVDYVAITTNLRVIIENNWYEDLQYVCTPTSFHYKRVTVSFTTNIGVTREFNRHRVNSIAEESTRYCNYNKRNDGEINIGLPAWIKDEDCPQEYIRDLNNMSIAEYCTDFVDNDTDPSDIWDEWCYYFFALKACEFAYNGLIAKGWKPQQAREVLPLATKSQLIHTAFVDDWKHFFALRAEGVSGPPHPNARLLAKPLYEEFKKRNLL